MSASTTAAEIWRTKKGEDHRRSTPSFLTFYHFIFKRFDFPPSDLQAGAKLVQNRQFSDERWTKNRVVTCLDWSPQVLLSSSSPFFAPSRRRLSTSFPTGCRVSPQYPELLVASYNNNEDAPHEPDGVALVWNLKYKKGTPEYIFHCQVRRAERHNGTSLPCTVYKQPFCCCSRR